jgi:phage N-6-adenine-methyltransferase
MDSRKGGRRNVDLQSTLNSEDKDYDKDGWCTPKKYVELAREVMGGIDVDPASNDYAQDTVKAGIYYTKETNGLDREWQGRVWLNPPYSNPLIKHFVSKLLFEYLERHAKQAILLVNSCTSTKWYHACLNTATAGCLVKGRIKFDHSERDSPAPRCDSTFFYFGPYVERFGEVFCNAGKVVVL